MPPDEDFQTQQMPADEPALDEQMNLIGYAIGKTYADSAHHTLLEKGRRIVADLLEHCQNKPVARLQFWQGLGQGLIASEIEEKQG